MNDMVYKKIMKYMTFEYTKMSPPKIMRFTFKS
jgi:hypothetical protein